MQVPKLDKITMLDNGYSVMFSADKTPPFEIWLAAPSGKTIVAMTSYEYNVALSCYNYCVKFASQL